MELTASVTPRNRENGENMKNIKNTLRAGTMLAVIAFGATFANAGIIIGGFSDPNPNPCKVTTKGIIIGGFTGIIIGGFTGIIIGGAKDEGCGIIIGG